MSVNVYLCSCKWLLAQETILLGMGYDLWEDQSLFFHISVCALLSFYWWCPPGPPAAFLMMLLLPPTGLPQVSYLLSGKGSLIWINIVFVILLPFLYNILSFHKMSYSKLLFSKLADSWFKENLMKSNIYLYRILYFNTINI